jgi:hypothetical protein
MSSSEEKETAFDIMLKSCRQTTSFNDFSIEAGMLKSCMFSEALDGYKALRMRGGVSERTRIQKHARATTSAATTQDMGQDVILIQKISATHAYWANIYGRFFSRGRPGHRVRVVLLLKKARRVQVVAHAGRVQANQGRGHEPNVHQGSPAPSIPARPGRVSPHAVQLLDGGVMDPGCWNIPPVCPWHDADSMLMIN